MKVPFVSLSHQIKENIFDIQQNFHNVLQNGVFIGGNTVDTFEKKFAQFIGSKYCISLNSGTDALILGTRALELKPHSEIIFPANTYYATLLAAACNDLKPVLVDVSPNDFGYNLNELKKKINARTSAIVVVHLYGQPDKIGEIQEIVKKSKRKIAIIEDSCQAHGAQYKNKRVGSIGEFSAFSFYPSKNLGAFGDGGAVTTNNSTLEKRLRRIKEYGQVKKYHHESIGVNSRLDTLQAAFLTYKLRYLNEWNKKRQKIATTYTETLKDVNDIVVPQTFHERQSIYHLYVIRVKNRERLQKYLLKNGVQTQIHYPFPIHLQKAWKHLGYKKGAFPESEKQAGEILSLPIFPELTEKHVLYVVNLIRQFYKT